MLKTRVITALIIAALLVPAIFLLDWLSWAVLTAVITGIAGWEYARLCGFCSSGQLRFGALIAGVAVLAAVMLPSDQLRTAGQVALFCSIVFWLGLVPFWLRARWQVKVHWKMALVGSVILLPTWFALIDLRERGPAWLFAALLLVALADIAAYFSGRAFGKRKLAPNISPGKTWEGAYGAMLATTILALIAQWSLSDAHPAKLILIVLVMPLLTLVSIAGDLFESLLKRQAGMKDSSQLLPGHGGVLDRIDSHTAALPLMAMLLMFLQ